MKAVHPLRRERLAQGLTQRALAQRSGFSHLTIRSIELWQRNPEPFTRECLMRTLGIPLDRMAEMFPVVSRSTAVLDHPLRRARRRRLLSQRALAKKAGVSTCTVLDIEIGRVREPQGSTQRALLGALGLGLERAAEIFPEAHR